MRELSLFNFSGALTYTIQPTDLSELLPTPLSPPPVIQLLKWVLIFIIFYFASENGKTMIHISLTGQSAWYNIKAMHRNDTNKCYERRHPRKPPCSRSLYHLLSGNVIALSSTASALWLCTWPHVETMTDMMMCWRRHSLYLNWTHRTHLTSHVFMFDCVQRRSVSVALKKKLL